MVLSEIMRTDLTYRTLTRYRVKEMKYIYFSLLPTLLEL